MKRTLAIILALVMALTMTFTGTAFGAESDTYLALGADLSDSEKATVLDLLGVDDTQGYEVLYVTNSEEHQYLDKYVDSSQIGERALSSVLIRQNSGSDIDVETHNIGFCTESMYRNALETAGVEGAEVIVAGPFQISGKAALVGAIKAYEEMTGENVDDDVIEGAVGEITTTGELGEEIGDKETAGEIINDIKEDLANNPDMSSQEIEESIIESAKEHGVELSEGAVDKTREMIEDLQGLNIDWGGFKDKAQELLNSGFFDRIINWFKSLFN